MPEQGQVEHQYSPLGLRRERGIVLQLLRAKLHQQGYAAWSPNKACGLYDLHSASLNRVRIQLQRQAQFYLDIIICSNRHKALWL